MARRIIVCDGLASARLWRRISASDDELLTWVPRSDETRSRPPGFHSLQGGLCAEAIAKLDPKAGDEFAVVSEETSFARSAVSVIAEAAAGAPLLVLGDKVAAESLPEHPCRCTCRHAGTRIRTWRTLGTSGLLDLSSGGGGGRAGRP